MFITFEGPEGAGKSTAIQLIAERLREAGNRVTTTREPGSGEVGAAIRQILLHGDALDPKCELFLFLADRAHHVASVVRPALKRDEIVLCDRFGDSTVVYQGVARELDSKVATEFNAFATGNLIPNLTLLLDLPVEKGLGRVTNQDRLDREPREFHEKVRQGFLNLAQSEPDRWVIIDASAPIEEVVAKCVNAIEARLTSS